MKNFQVAATVGVVVLAGLGLTMAVTNPGQAEYEEFAVQRLTEYLQGNVCTRAPAIFGLREQCAASIVTLQPQMQELIARGTQRQNFILFSRYQTYLSADTLLPPWATSLVPAYQVEAIGVFQQFQIYKAEERPRS